MIQDNVGWLAWGNVIDQRQGDGSSLFQLEVLVHVDQVDTTFGKETPHPVL
jgi:hypothetical protein